MAPTRPPSPSPSNLPPIPSSPTFSYASTAYPIPSTFNLPLPPPPSLPHAVLTKSDLSSSQEAYSTLLSTAKEYRLALATLSQASSTFGSALETCARLKEARSESLRGEGGGSMSGSFIGRGSCTADHLLSASGIHHLISNHVQILSETVYRAFEVPLLHDLDTWQRHMEEENEAYTKRAKSLSSEIRKLEKEGLKLHRQRKRDVGSLREHLVLLTSKLDGLTTLHGSHSRGLLGDCQHLSRGVVDCSAGLVRAEVDIFEGLARKGWSGGGLDELLEKGKDLFANESDTIVDSHQGNANNTANSKIFSILPQNRSILAVDGNEGQNENAGTRGHRRNDSLMTDGLTYQSLAGAVVRDTDVLSIFSDNGGGTTGLLNRPRGARPFSPPPLERVRVSDPLDDIKAFGKEERGRSKSRDGAEGEIEAEPEPETERRDDGVTQDELKTDKSKEKSKKTQDVKVQKDVKRTMSDESAASKNSKDRQRRWSVTDEGTASE